MTHRLLLVAALPLLVQACALESKTCTMIDMTTTANVVVVDRETKAPICDATVQITSGPKSGAAAPAISARPIAATADAPCSYRGGSFSEGSVGTTLTYLVERAGYQSSLTTGVVPSSADECHVGTPTQTIELSKLPDQTGLRGPRSRRRAFPLPAA